MNVLCFGEIMLRLSPPGYLRLTQATALEMAFGGAEANVAVSLANYGARARFITRLPKNPIAEACLQQLRGMGVDTSGIVTGGSRVGTYFVEKGASMRPSKVIYDRAHSAIAEAGPQDFDWPALMDGADGFHFTGITPALGDGPAAAALAACKAAKAAGVPVSCDLNYRKNLWSREKAGAVLGELAKYVDLLIANEEDAADVFGIHAAGADIEGGALNLDGYRDVAAQLADRFGCARVAITLRESQSANDNGWSALLYDAKTRAIDVSRKYAIHIVDRVGGGDAFGAGLIYGLLSGMPPREALEFAVAASALKQTIEGDFNRVSAEEVRALMSGGGSGRVQR